MINGAHKSWLFFLKKEKNFVVMSSVGWRVQLKPFYLYGHGGCRRLMVSQETGHKSSSWGKKQSE